MSSSWVFKYRTEILSDNRELPDAVQTIRADVQAVQSVGQIVQADLKQIAALGGSEFVRTHNSAQLIDQLYLKDIALRSVQLHVQTVLSRNRIDAQISDLQFLFTDRCVANEDVVDIQGIVSARGPLEAKYHFVG